MPFCRPGSRSVGWVLGVLVLALSAVSAAQQSDGKGIDNVPVLSSPVGLGDLAGRPVSRVEVEVAGPRWTDVPTVRRVRIGDRLTPYLARLAMRELLDSGRFASAEAEALVQNGEVVLRLTVVPRRIVGGVKLTGTGTLVDEALRASGLDAGDEVTAEGLGERAEAMRAFYVDRGFPSAEVGIDAVDTDDPMRVLVLFSVELGPPRLVARRIFEVARRTRRLETRLGSYIVEPGDRADERVLDEADRELRRELRAAGWHRATVTHRLGTGDRRADLVVSVDAGPRIRLRFEGATSFDVDELTAAVEVDESEPVTLALVESRVRGFYVDRGFLDVDVRVFERGRADEPVHDLVAVVREGDRVRVAAREFPCLTGERSADDVGQEIDGVLSEALPGADVLTHVDGHTVDRSLGPRGATGARPTPIPLNPWKTYSPEAYERAMDHLRELYRSEGYLSALIGPAVPLRRRCDPRSAPGHCVVRGSDYRRPPTVCPATATELPVEDDAPPPGVTCQPDPKRGVRCESDVVVHMPIKLGPRAYFWDVAFEGNEALLESELLEVAEVELGAPASQIAVERARRRVLDAYAEEGFAFAAVDVELDLSPDRTRARARFIISESEQVTVKGIVVRGARLTNESLILGRVALEEGGLYRRSLVRDTEERLATLGVFSSVTVGLEDPEVPARQKLVVITVVERPPQYLDVRPGFSTGEGIRVTFEYGHRNLGGEAIQLVLRVQLGYLPDPFILDSEVRRKYGELNLGERLERRNTASLEFPEIGLGPLFRLGLDGVDVRDNARDFGLTKNAFIVTLSYRPTSRFTTQVGASIERNDTRIFGQDEKGALEDYIRDNPGARNLLVAAEGTTLAFAQRTGVTWDRRDNPFGASRGTFVSGGVEHVRAIPISDTNIDSHFLQFTNRLAGYVPLSDAGLSVALSFRWGTNAQIAPGSQTYPDRLFFLGGVDSIRGFLQNSVIPQDIAERIIATQDLPDDNPNKLTEREVVLRGGDFLLNPRGEVRIPLGGVWATALFVDAGNVWVEPENVSPEKLRYAAGSGLRAITPVGPLAFDFGVNLDRRAWEDPFAFHFSIGLF